MRVLIVGGDSVTGAAFARAAAERGHTIYETTRHRDTTGGNRLYLDLAADDVQKIELPKVDAAFFCAAISGFARCRQNPALARKVNFENTAIVARRLMTVDTYAVLLSSTAVFDFQTPYVAADAPTRPHTLHGEIKAEAEKVFLAGGAHGAVLRLTKVLTADSGHVPAWIKALRRREHIVAFSDLHIAPISLEDATAAMLAVAEDRSSGVYQMSGASDVSYHEVAVHLAQTLKCPTDLVEAKRAVDAGLPAEEIARYTSLDSSRLERLAHRTAPDPYAVIDTVYGAQIKAEM